MECSGFGWQCYLFNPADIDWRFKKTIEFAIKLKKPWLHLYEGAASPEIALSKFIREHKIATLNVAGPQASKEPEVGVSQGE